MQYTYNILDGFSVTIDFSYNPYNLPPEAMFGMAARRNKKRGFLFVSKILGKHMPNSPYIPLIAGYLLSAHYMKVIHNVEHEGINRSIEALVNSQYLENTYKFIKNNPLIIPEETIFIGFAETATALGNSMFDVFQDKVTYIHTTRELISNMDSILDFNEDHSHAVEHYLYSYDKNLLNCDKSVVIIDDEITTGNSSLNIIRAIHRIHPRKSYVIASFLDWRSDENKMNFQKTEEELQTRIQTVSLLAGNIKVEGSPDGKILLNPPLTKEETGFVPSIKKIHIDKSLSDYYPISAVNTNGAKIKESYLHLTGRFGINSHDKEKFDQYVDNLAQYLAKTIGIPNYSGKTLCLGTGEFMYIPMKIAALLGENIYYHSSTRSPIYPDDREGYAVKNAFQFTNTDDNAIVNYLYNIPYGCYENLYMFFEHDYDEERMKSLEEVLNKLGIPNIYMVIFL